MAADKNITKIINLKIKGAEALGTIDKLTKELEAQKKIIAGLNAETKAGNALSKSQKEDMLLAAASSKQLQKEITAQTNVLKNNVAVSRTVSGSLKDMRAQYNTLKTTYEGLSATQRKEVIPQMKEIKNKIEEADKAVGNYSTSVGKYENAFSSLPGPIGAAANSVKGLSAAFKMLLLNPVVLVITLIVGALALLFKAFKSTDEGANMFAGILKGLGNVLDVLLDRTMSYFKLLGSIITLDFAGMKKNAKDAFGGVADAIKDAAEAGYNYVQIMDNIGDREAASLIRSSKLRKEIEELKNATKNAALPIKERMRLSDLGLAKAIELNKIEKGFLKEKNDAELKNLASLIQVNGMSTKEKEKQINEWLKLDDRQILQYAKNNKRFGEFFNKNEDAFQALQKMKADEFDKDAEYQRETRRMQVENFRFKKEIQDDAANFTKQKNAEQLAAENKQREEINKIANEALEKEKKRLDEILEGEKAANSKVLVMRKELQDRIKAQSDEADKIVAENKRAIAEMDGLAIFDYEKDQLRLKMESELLNTKLTEEEKKLIRERYRKEDLNLEDEKTKAKLQLASQFVGALSGVFDKGTIAAKGIASTQIAIDGIAGAFSAYKSMIGSGLPPPFNFIAGGVAAAGVIAASVKSIGDVWKVKKPESSGGGGGGAAISPTSIPAVPAQPTYTTTTLNLGNADTGNRGAQSNQADAMKLAMQEAYASMPAPVVKVSDIQSVTASQNNIKNVSVI